MHRDELAGGQPWGCEVRETVLRSRGDSTRDTLYFWIFYDVDDVVRIIKNYLAASLG